MSEERSQTTTSDVTAGEGMRMERPDAATTTMLDRDRVFESLAHPRRRYLLYTLVNGEESEHARLAELATNIAAGEANKPVVDVTDAERDRIQLSLYHSHLPKLADLNLVDYTEAETENAGDVTIRSKNTEEVAAMLDCAEEALAE